MKIILLALAMLGGTGAHAEPMTFELHGNGGNCNGCEWIAASGEITSDTPNALRAFLGDRDRLYAEVLFDSPGGNLGAAIEVGRILRRVQARTTVGRSSPMEGLPQWDERRDGARCESACVFALLGGNERRVEPGQLGVHQFHAPGARDIPTSATQQIMGQIVLYLIDMGISPEILTLASRVPGDSMHYLSADELGRFDIGTASTLTPLMLEVEEGGLVARWDALNDDGTLDRAHRLRCSQEHSAWLLSVRDTGISRNNLIIGDDMFVALGDRNIPMGQESILDRRQDGPDHRITVRLPVDLRDAPGVDMTFQTNTARNFFMVLSASGQVPGAATLDAMVRACGD